jgi:glycosyltransferase A (GT-A) superfamily protein (DUF2064 family)
MKQTPDSRQQQALAAFFSRLRWHCHFMQKLEDEPAIEHRAFVPAFDGGYALIGLRGRAVAPFTAIFEQMPWSTPGLMAATRVHLAAAGLRHAELPPLPDIDEPADLVHLPAGWAR